MAENLIFLNEKDFSIDENKNLICNTLKYNQFTACLFFSNKCPHCHTMKEILKELNQLVNGCKFAMVNLDDNRNLILKSQKTNCNIEFVPFLVFFVKNEPHMIYSGSPDKDSVLKFIIDVSNNTINNSVTDVSVLTNDNQSVPENSCNINNKECITQAKKQYNPTAYMTMNEAYK